MAKKNKDIEKKMLEAQEKMKSEIKAKNTKKYKPVKEQYAEIKESLKPKVKEINSENELLNELFDLVDEIDEVIPETVEQRRPGL
jgi:23S rRNA maturation-related 3'-5' exoribonuclease YhaM